MPAKPFFKKKSVRILLTIIILMGLFIGYMAIVAIDRPPYIKDMSSLNLQRIDHGNATYSYGQSWLRKSESGLWEAYIEGNAFERGVAFGQLTKELLYYQESSFFGQIRELVPSDGYLRVLKYFIAFFNRNLDKNIPDAYKEEIYGTSFACDSTYNFIGSGYQRQLNYHAAHDIGHALQGLNLVACTSFSVWEDKSRDSSLIVGRNFDFYMGDKFAENKIVCFVNPDHGHKFMMITWADMIGVVSGMNEKGLTVTLNAAKSGIPFQAAMPVTLLAREILQYASNIDEAYSIAQMRDIFVSESIMIGSSMDHQTAIIEKSPDETALYDPEGNSIICSNHYQSDEYANDRKNINNIRNSDSYNRYRRVQELLNRKENLDETDVAAILRDQSSLGDANAGMGNELAINQLIAHHSVIFKPDSLLVWISTAPWQLGKYVAYDLNRVFNDASNYPVTEICMKEKTIPADPFLFTDNYNRFVKFREMSKELRLMKNTNHSLPEKFVDNYIETNPQFFLTYSNLGDYYNEMKDFNQAYAFYKKAMDCRLPGLEDKQNLEELTEKLSKKINNGSSRY
ncbi:MAG TPA: C45 family peptidase [Bacteroidales bacterium]|jgi:hypothetical protein|nr:C45 family peptidase [Bacteroidales bacterium]